MPWGPGIRALRWQPRLLVVAFALTLPGSALPAQDAPPTVTLRGRVVDARSGQSLVKARVVVRDHGERLTDASGRFALAGIPPGVVAIDVWAAGYGGRRLVVSIGVETAEIEVRLDPEDLRR